MSTGTKLRDAALDLFEQHRAAALRDLERLASKLLLASEAITPDDVRSCWSPPPGVKPAIVGAAFRNLARRKHAVLDGYRQSTRPETHARPVGIWRLIDRDGVERWLASNPPIAPPVDDPSIPLFAGATP